ncbi:YeaH/YhbH family protein [Granulosicoccaceae sp. 1_MG-2023]|nr:YeaH/YhbH family protein [Granulosicoccaceae sp. 1_MG-2023]
MSYIIDRRLNSKKKSTVNRQRFLRRYRKHIKRAVDQAVNSRSITDLERGEQITIPGKDLSEPFFQHGQGGVSKRVFPGNKEFVTGDEFKRPEGGGGGGSGDGQASDSGEGEDAFTFQINQEEFLEYIFSDLELPNLVKKQLKDSSEFSLRRGGFTKAGSPEKLNIVRSLRSAHARRIALSGKERRRVRELRRELEPLEALEKPDEIQLARMEEIRAEIKKLQVRIHRMPFIDDFDLKFNNYVKVPNPSSKAVMFCVMDVSGSMTQDIKNIAKRFFLLLYLFLTRSYKEIEVVFVRHHTQAKEVDEQEFFYSRETGGTIVSSALKLTSEIIEQRYNPADWNIYVAQASDGDNWEGDSPVARELIEQSILPYVQYFAYVEITRGPIQNLWMEYAKIERENEGDFAMEQITDVADIYPVFRRLFEKRNEA